MTPPAPATDNGATAADAADAADEHKSVYSALDKFVIEDVSRYIQWARENPKEMFRNPRSVVHMVINNLYASIACNDLNHVVYWQPRYFRLPADAPTWRDEILYRSISDAAMAESARLAAESGLKFENP